MTPRVAASQNETEWPPARKARHPQPETAMSTSLPAPRPRQTFPQISAVSWEHPADRAALQTLRSIPGVDDVIRKTLSLLGGERGVRLLFQGNAIRIGPAQF